MRESIASMALVQRTDQGRRFWLTQWNEKWQRFNLIGGHKHPDESYRECLIREIQEELYLVEGTDFVVADQPIAQLDYTDWSESAGQETHYQIELFRVEFVGNAAREKVDTDERNRWLSEDAIAGLQGDSGKLVSRTMTRLLNHLLSRRQH